MAPHQIAGAFKRAVLRASLPPIHLHDLRHGWATMLGRARVLAKTISAVLGHANAGITLDLYAHLDLIDQDGAVTALKVAFANEGDEGEEPVRAIGGSASPSRAQGH